MKNIVSRVPLRLRCALIVGLVSLVAIAGPTSAADQADQGAGTTIAGRLAVVEPAAARIAVLAEGDVNLRAFDVAPDAEITQGERKLTLSELVIEVGRRVSIRFRSGSERAVAVAISVEPAPAQ